jgi:flagellin
MRVNTNVNAMNAHKNMTRVDNGLSKSLEKLSSGLRINRASDDAGGLAISESLRTQVRGLAQAEKNAQDGISLLNVAEGALNEIHGMLQRMRELAVQSANGTLTNAPDRAALEVEFGELVTEINRIPQYVTFNTLPLFTTTAGLTSDFTLQVGANQGETIMASIPAIDVPGTFGGLPPTPYIDNQLSAQNMITTVTTFINSISDTRARLGAQTNRLEYTINNLQTTRENMSAAESRIRDTDMASEMTNLTRQQILMQSSTAMLAQANAQPQSILSLFQ